MRNTQQRLMDSLRRVQDFLDANSAVLGTLKTSDGRKQLDAAAAAIAALGNTQGSATRVLAGQISRERALAKQLISSHMVPIAKFARARLRGVPDFAALSQPKQSRNTRALVAGARAMATAAAPHAAALTAGGFPPDTIAQLNAAATALSEATTARANTMVGRVGATVGIADHLRRGREGVKMLDAVISKQFASDSTFLAAWRAAHRVAAKPGVSRKPAVGPEVGKAA